MKNMVKLTTDCESLGLTIPSSEVITCSNCGKPMTITLVYCKKHGNEAAAKLYKDDGCTLKKHRHGNSFKTEC